MVNIATAQTKPLKILFLGDNDHHQPAARYYQLEPVFKARGIDLTYTNKVDDLNLEKLNQFDGLMIFANHVDWKPENEKALLEYVRSGKGFIPVHCASYCFLKSPAYMELVGAQFRSHTTGVFRTTTVADHPIMKGCDSFSSWDETYVHHKHNEKGRTVLEVRGDGDLKEPWTWVRDEGKGRVFYTAWGHDHRTWSHAGFHALLERGTRWACGQSLDGVTTYIDRPKMTPFAADAKPFEYVPAKLPHYVANGRGKQDAIAEMQKPLSAAESLKHYTVPEGFEMKPFVTEEQYGGGKPICMTWDERGRLYLALTWDYPNEKQPEGEGHDKIICCEDTKGTGVCDKVTVFAEKLSIPTSMLRVHGGLIVHQAPHTLFLKDTDGDGKADVKQILFSGWGVQDTHAGPSNLRYGPDGWIYSMCGYSGFNGEVAGERIRFSQGLFRFKLEMKDKLQVTKLEFLRSTTNNSWGVGFNAHGELFGSTANGCPLVHLTIPNRYYEKVKGLTPGALQNIALDWHCEPVVKEYRQVDWHGGFTAAAACTPYTGGVYPPEYNNVIFICEPTAHLVAAMVLQPNGSSYVAHYGWNLCASNDDWAAPIDAQVGPDGNVWVIDWYNIIVQHNPTPSGYKTGKGNAYEIDLRDKKYGRVYRVVNKNAKPQEKVDFEKALGTKDLLGHPNHFWRTQSKRFRDENPGSWGGLSNLLSIEQKLSGSPRLKLNTLLELADRPDVQNGGVLIAKEFESAANFKDAALRDALAIAGSVYAEKLLPEILKTTSLPKESLPVVSLIARNYSGNLNTLLTALVEAKNALASDAVIDGLGSARLGKPELNSSSSAAIAKLLVSLKGQSRAQLLKLASAWGVKGLDAQFAEIAKGLAATVVDEKATDDARLDAARQVIELLPESDEAATQLISAATKASPKLAASIFEILTQSKAKNLGPAVAANLKTLPPTARPAALGILLARTESTKAFLDAVEKGELRFDMLSLDQKTSLATHPDAAIRERAKKILALGGGLPDADRQKVINQFLAITKKSGDAAAGKAAFVKHCAKCHKHGSEGTVIGPDLTGFAVHPKEEILIAVLDPSRSVEGNFKQYTAKLADGRVVSGLLASETKTSVEILDAENKRHAIARDDLDELNESPKSLMPEGFEKQMTEKELTDLMEFLTQKGKYLPIPLDKLATVSSAKGMFFEPDGQLERLMLKDWKPRTIKGVPFTLVDPQDGKQKNVILLNGPNGNIAPTMPKSVTLPCNTSAKAIHLLSGISGWGHLNGTPRGTTSMIVKLNYADGTSEEHPLKDGVHFADYIHRVDVKESEHAIEFLGKQQGRYLAVTPKKSDMIKSIELVKGPDRTAPIVIAVTVETP